MGRYSGSVSWTSVSPAAHCLGAWLAANGGGHFFDLSAELSSLDASFEGRVGSAGLGLDCQVVGVVAANDSTTFEIGSCEPVCSTVLFAWPDGHQDAPKVCDLTICVTGLSFNGSMTNAGGLLEGTATLTLQTEDNMTGQSLGAVSIPSELLLRR